MLKIFLAILFIPLFYAAQELNAVVNVNFEQVSTVYKEKLSGFADAVQNYLNSNKFTGSTWEGERIDCSFNIYIMSGSGEYSYTAKAVITSQRPIYGSEGNTLMFQVLDDKWSFKYEKNQSNFYDPLTFDAWRSFLDFYALTIIGLDADTYEMHGGTDLFRQAYNICILGANSVNSEGWNLERGRYNKRALIEDLSGSVFHQFREDVFNYHYNGLDILHRKREAGMKNMFKLISNLDKIREQLSRAILTKVFFDAKHKELIEIFKDEEDKSSIFKVLKRVDPNHISKYNEVSDD